MQKLNKKKLIGIAIIGLILIALPIIIFQLQRSQDLRQRASGVPAGTGETKIYLSPDTGFEVTKNTQFNVELKMDTKGKAVANFTIQLAYDSSKFTYNSIQKNSQFDVVSANPNIGNSQIRILAETDPSNPITGDNIAVATLSFTSKDALGTGTIVFQDSPLNVVGKNGNAIISLTTEAPTVTYEIKDAATPSDTPTPSNTPVPSNTPPPTTVSPTPGTIGYIVDSAGKTFYKVRYSPGQLASTPCDVIETTTCDSAPTKTSPNKGTCKMALGGTNYNFPIYPNASCPNVTNTPTPTVTNTPTPTNTGTPSPSNTPTPTSTPAPGSTNISLNLTLPGIGSNAPVEGLGTSNSTEDPLRKTRTVEVMLKDQNGETLEGTYTGNVVFDAQSFTFKGTVNLGDIDTGNYEVIVRNDNSLYTKIPGFKLITKAQTTSLPLTRLIAGDIDRGNNSNDILDLNDYILFKACFQDKPICTAQAKVLADLNDNGEIDTYDLGIMQSGFITRSGASQQ